MFWSDLLETCIYKYFVLLPKIKLFCEESERANSDFGEVQEHSWINEKMYLPFKLGRNKAGVYKHTL
jgi:hypothetical protein